jgi:hypothetical protein
MLVDEVLKLARYLRIDPKPPEGISFGYQCSYAGWLLAAIEREVGIKAEGQLGKRFERAKQAAFNKVDKELGVS